MFIAEDVNSFSITDVAFYKLNSNFKINDLPRNI